MVIRAGGGSGGELELPEALEELAAGTGPDASVATAIADAPATLELDPDGRFTASDGCATTSGRYDLDDGTLALTPDGWTEEACEDVAPQADHVRAVLEVGAVEVAVDGDRLTLTAGDRDLVYRADAA